MVPLMWAILLFLNTDSVFGLRCLECSDMPTPADCDRITTCGPTESCYVDQLVTSSGVVLYNTGCRSHFRCAGPSGKRFLASSTDIITCSQCCNSEFCNLEGCGVTALSPPQRGIYCFECDAQDSPDTCRDVVMCDFDHTCYLEKVVNNAVQPFYRSHCIEEKACAALDKVTAMTGGLSVDQCPMCCRSDFCNDNCRRNITGSTHSSSCNSPISTTKKSTTSSTTSIQSSTPAASGGHSSLLTTFSVLNAAQTTDAITNPTLTANSSPNSTNIIHSSTQSTYSIPSSLQTTRSWQTSTQTTKSAQTSSQPTHSSMQSTLHNATRSQAQNTNMYFSISPSAVSTSKSHKLTTLAMSLQSAQSTLSVMSTSSAKSTLPVMPSSSDKSTAQVMPSSSAKSTLPIMSTQSAKSTSIAKSTPQAKSTASTVFTPLTMPSTAVTTYSTVKPTTIPGSHWSQWRSWSHCHCHGYIETRHRHCVNGHHGQHGCLGNSTDTRPCTQPNNCHTSHSHTAHHTTRQTPRHISHTARHTNHHTVKHTTNGPSHQCDATAGYHLINTHSTVGYMCLKLYTTPKTWTHAKAQCLNDGHGGHGHGHDGHHGHLVVLDSPPKEKALTTFLQNVHAYTTSNALWIGMAYRQHSWDWINGSPINQHNSNNVLQFVHQNPLPHYPCAARLKSGAWSTLECNIAHMFVCEISL